MACLLSVVFLGFGCGGDSDGDTTADSGTATDVSTTNPSTLSASTTASTSTSAGPTTATTAGTDSSSGGTGTESSGTAADTGSSTGAATATWDNFAMAFFETYCWECHGAGDPLRDYTTLAGVLTESDAIRCGTSPAAAPAENCAGQPPAGQFPVGPGPVPTDEERTTLVEWFDAGAPEN